MTDTEKLSQLLENLVEGVRENTFNDYGLQQARAAIFEEVDPAPVSVPVGLLVDLLENTITGVLRLGNTAGDIEVPRSTLDWLAKTAHEMDWELDRKQRARIEGILSEIYGGGE